MGRLNIKGGRAVLLTLPQTGGVEPTELSDFSGNGNSGTYTDITDTQLANGLWTWTLVKDNANKITIADHASLDLTSALTMAIWLKKTEADSNFMIGKRLQGSDDAYGLATDGSLHIQIDIFVGNVRKFVAGDTAMNTGAWHFAVGTYDKTYLRVYKDGVLDCTPEAATGDIDSTVDAVAIGWGYHNDYSFGGQLALPRIYNYALTSSEITALYNSQSSLFA